MMQAGHRPEERGLATAGRSDDAEKFALANLDRDIVERVNRAGTCLVEFGGILDHHLRLRRRSGRGNRHVHDIVPRAFIAWNFETMLQNRPARKSHLRILSDFFAAVSLFGKWARSRLLVQSSAGSRQSLAACDFSKRV